MQVKASSSLDEGGFPQAGELCLDFANPDLTLPQCHGPFERMRLAIPEVSAILRFRRVLAHPSVVDFDTQDIPQSARQDIMRLDLSVLLFQPFSVEFL
jgi:hypothetical protein